MDHSKMTQAQLAAHHDPLPLPREDVASGDEAHEGAVDRAQPDAAQPAAAVLVKQLPKLEVAAVRPMAAVPRDKGLVPEVIVLADAMDHEEEPAERSRASSPELRTSSALALLAEGRRPNGLLMGHATKVNFKVSHNPIYRKEIASRWPVLEDHGK